MKRNFNNHGISFSFAHQHAIALVIHRSRRGAPTKSHRKTKNPPETLQAAHGDVTRV